MDHTPPLIRYLLILTAGLTLLSALLEPLFGGLSWLFSLSWQGLQHGFFWQIVTFLFLEPTGGFGPSLPFLIGLAFNLYLLWIMGSDLYGYIGKAAFLRFYLISGVFAGLVALWVMHLTGQWSVLSGSAPALLALATAWTLFHPNLQIFFLLLFPIQAKWLFAILAALCLLIPLSHLDFVSLALYVSAILFAYGYAMVAWELTSPFAWTRGIDRLLASLGNKLRSIKLSKKSKIIDFKTGEPILDDEHFVDAMLEKISKQGEDALTWKERERLQAISKAKKQKK